MIFSWSSWTGVWLSIYFYLAEMTIFNEELI